MAISACPQAGSDGRQPPGAGAAFANAATAMAAMMTLTAKRIANKERMETGKVAAKTLDRGASVGANVGVVCIETYDTACGQANCGVPVTSQNHEVSDQSRTILARRIYLTVGRHASVISALRIAVSYSFLNNVMNIVAAPDDCGQLTPEDRIQQLKDHQARCAQQQAWWLSKKIFPAEGLIKVDLDPSRPRLSRHSSCADLSQALSAAISAPLAPLTLPMPEPQYKTSDSHPIKVSPLIPFELLRVISSHLTRVEEPSPVIFDLPPAYHIDRVVTHLPDLRANFVCRAAVPPAPSPNSVLGLRSITPPCAPKLTAVGDGGIGQIDFLDVSRDVLSAHKKIAEGDLRRSHSAPSAIPHGNTCEPEVPVPSMPPQFAVPTSFTLGNLFLSSCPGKKVRLNGPVKGRATICRDLTADLQRIKELGVACIVCCLDDDELELLGVSWNDYACLTNELGMDVLRIPIPEGLPPASADALDTELTTVINTYTLRGASVLAHCRGGLGRAGLVACCWLVKLGLCGWIETAPAPAAPEVRAASSELLERHMVRRDTMQLVERVIGIVRRQRSPKAVETYEQVQFLVDFIELLRAKSASSVVNTGAIADWESFID
ncbi:hypothetical protein POSPLADRAFT_1132029 [Postia placenta MAD-698-R-SB12]|uniref:Tyrosine specific protein phosphatases domain-containing protein n=1 Tax=Postia placenta MAD-698-R-SB12 TaxID=670580 RepID=A0A1X6NDB3_9APHY|nr:hypothetical protein POSPLADRAFT_1132029 [Postia placenta MAD-698-R-SB12]OSX66635.1 hypothetical protein POSPLADRAFT_1132029 [Postia placenta MAD-698-R-SB12]